MKFDHILIIGFGGPTRPEEVRPFIENVTRGVPIPEERLKEVENHYLAVGGASPYNEWAHRLTGKIHEKLSEQGVTLPVFIGMRNWNPFLKDTIAAIQQKGLKKGIGVILAPHRCDASYEKYIRAVEEAKQAANAGKIEYQYLKSWHDHPGFVQAQASVILRPKAEESTRMEILFTAHSIPLEMAQKSKYVEEVTQSSELVAKTLGVTKWRIGWQSRSGNPKQPWLEPDVISVIKDYKEQGEKSVMLVPIGFLCDNVEVLYDLDIEAKEAAKKIGIEYHRASTVNDHPQFVVMLADLIQELC